MDLKTLFSIDTMVTAMQCASRRVDGSRALGDFEYSSAESLKGTLLVRTNASKVGIASNTDGKRMSFQVHTSAWTLLAIALRALKEDKTTVYITLNGDTDTVVAKARGKTQARRVPTPQVSEATQELEIPAEFAE